MGASQRTININVKIEYLWKESRAVHFVEVGVVYYELLQPSQTINPERYRHQLLNSRDGT